MPALVLWWAMSLAGTGVAAEVPPETAAPGYEFGRGLRLGASGFTLGGYVTGEYRRNDGGDEQLKSSHASVFVWWEGLSRVKLFAEIDLLNAVGPTQDALATEYGKQVDVAALIKGFQFDSHPVEDAFDPLVAAAGSAAGPACRPSSGRP